jgi:hypothetical protein
MKIKQQYKNYLKEKFFFLYKYLYKPVSRIFMFEVEKKLLNNEHIEPSDFQSILFFTTYKCASSFADEIINELTVDAGYKHVNFDSYFYHTEKDTDSEYEKIFSKNVFRRSGFIYGPMRRYQPIPDINEYKTLLILRDPRDVLVSHYYSAKYSHEVSTAKMLQKRRMTQVQGIDEFVLERLEEFANIYEQYKLNVLPLDGSIFVRYEDMISNPKDFIIKLYKIIKINIDSEHIEEIVKNRMAMPKKEDKYSHRRSGKSGQYLEKLNSKTIKAINSRLANVIDAFGYSE